METDVDIGEREIRKQIADIRLEIQNLEGELHTARQSYEAINQSIRDAEQRRRLAYAALDRLRLGRA